MGAKEIVVFELTSTDSRCSECGEALGRGSFLTKEGERGLCMACADLDHLVFLPAGDAALTRRAGEYTGARIVVVRFSRARKRFERQGTLVTEAAIDRAERECLEDADARARARAAGRRAEIDREFVEEYARHVRERYPNCPEGEETRIAEHACRKHSGRVGRTAAAKEFAPRTIDLAVRAHVRHVHTDYDERLYRTANRTEARSEVEDRVAEILDAWSRPAQ